MHLTIVENSDTKRVSLFWHTRYIYVYIVEKAYKRASSVHHCFLVKGVSRVCVLCRPTIVRAFIA